MKTHDSSSCTHPEFEEWCRAFGDALKRHELMNTDSLMFAAWSVAWDRQAERIQALEAENADLREQARDVEAAREVIRRDREFQEWAQSHLNSARWAGHDRADAVKTELLEAEGALSQIRQQIEGLPTLDAPIGSGVVTLPPGFKVEKVVRYAAVRDLLGVPK